MKKLTLILLSIISLFLLCGCQKSQQADKPTVKIGLVAELSGAIPQVGVSAKNAAMLAIDEINAQDTKTIDGKPYKLDLIVKDTETNAEQAAKKTQDLVNEKQLLAIVGPMTSGGAIPAANVAEENKTLLLTPTATDPQTTLDSQGKPKHYVYRVCFTDKYQLAVLGKFARENLKAKTAALLYDSKISLLQSQAELFQKNFTKRGGKVVAQETYSTGDTDFSAQFNKIKALHPDVIFLGSYYAAVPQQIKQARSLGIKSKFLGSDSWVTGDTLPQDCDKNCNGSYFSDYYYPEAKNVLAQKFIIAYKNRYGKEPSSVAAATYDAFGLLNQALQTTQLDREALRNALAKIRTYQGVTGKISYTGLSGDPEKGAVIMQIKDGKFVLVTTVKP